MSPQRRTASCLRRHPLPGRGGDDRRVRDAARAGARRERPRGRGDRRRQRLDRRQRRPRARRRARRVVDEPRRGYGSAYLAGLAAARGDYIVMVDADLTYDFREIPRVRATSSTTARSSSSATACSGIQPGAMPLLSRLGNPLLSGFLNVLHRTNIHDAHCGMRALRRDVLPVAQPAHGRDGVRVGDGDPRDARAPRRAGDPDRAPPACRRVEAVAVPRRLAAPPPDPRLQPDVPVPRARAR